MLPHVSEHSNQHWCFFKTFIEGSFIQSSILCNMMYLKGKWKMFISVMVRKRWLLKIWVWMCNLQNSLSNCQKKKKKSKHPLSSKQGINLFNGNKFQVIYFRWTAKRNKEKDCLRKTLKTDFYHFILWKEILKWYSWRMHNFLCSNEENRNGQRESLFWKQHISLQIINSKFSFRIK